MNNSSTFHNKFGVLSYRETAKGSYAELSAYFPDEDVWDKCSESLDRIAISCRMITTESIYDENTDDPIDPDCLSDFGCHMIAVSNGERRLVAMFDSVRTAAACYRHLICPERSYSILFEVPPA